MKLKFALLAAAIAMASAANAAIFTVTWSGAQFGNTASAVGVFDIDTSLFPNLGGAQPTNPVGTGFSIISFNVSGSAGGNGSFTQADFGSFYFAAFSPLNYSQQLIGQTMGNGFNFGSFGAGYGGPSGDFNLFSVNPGAPTGSFYFQLTTAGGDNIGVTSFAPGTVPEPASWAMLIAGFGLTGAALRRRRGTVAA
ncbi:PEPxxWA-CTERM sorting domain-containing protein [Sandarakinorhabdus oryzae]|uniref:PEPxxWA-CTERM sorting domain-containing protein n=1 Tax=Sandarakinorhabdus oryzae TaxID=2675220 RepID=UPI001F44B8B0|nr:PEPxxWA-CTERM sorting domain-containing protein [Sandarakinorhabdus oryzae]